MPDPDLLADIDATSDLEEAMVEAARPLAEQHDYTLSDLIDVLGSALWPDD